MSDGVDLRAMNLSGTGGTGLDSQFAGRDQKAKGRGNAVEQLVSGTLDEVFVKINGETHYTSGGQWIMRAKCLKATLRNAVIAKQH